MAKEKILVVDDSKPNNIITTSFLDMLGYVSCAITNPKDIFSSLETFQPDLILLDIHMPGISGVDVLHKIKNVSKTQSIPVIMLTADTDKSIINRCFEAGASDYLPKPIDIMGLKSRLASSLKIRNLAKKLLEIEKKALYKAVTVSTNHHMNQPLTIALGSLEMIELFHSDSIPEEPMKLIRSALKGLKDISEIISAMEGIESNDYEKYSGAINMIQLDLKKRQNSINQADSPHI